MKCLPCFSAAVCISFCAVLPCSSAHAQDKTAATMTATEGFNHLLQQGKVVIAEPVPDHLSAGFDTSLRVTPHGSLALCSVNPAAQFALPAVTSEEVIGWMRDSRQSIARWWAPKPTPPRVSPGSYRIVNLVRHLEKTDKTRIPLTDLAGENKEFCDFILFDNYIGGLAQLSERADKFLNQFSKTYLIRTDMEGHGRVLQLRIEGQDEVPPVTLYDYDQPPDLSAMDGATDTLEGQTTLGAFVVSLSAKSSTPMSVAPELVNKPLIIRGGEKQAPEALLRAVADLYKLRVLHDTASFRLAPARPLEVSTPILLRKSLLLSVPAPLRGWAFSAPQEIESSLQLERNQHLLQWRNKLYGYLGQIYDKRVKGKTGERVAVSSLSAQDKSIIAVALMCPYLENMAFSLRTVPSWVQKYNEITVEVGRNIVEGEECGFVIFRDADGKPLADASGARFSRVPEP